MQKCLIYFSKILLTALLAITGFVPSGLFAQADAGTVVLGKKITFSSKILNEERELWIYVPDRYESTSARYPVLYLLDGNGHFHHASATTQFLSRNGRIPQMIVVAIPNTDRSRDFTPTKVQQPPNTGGADNFQKFLKDELIPYIDDAYRTEPLRVLFGHSLTAMFSIYTLLNQPDLFNGYIAVSPYVMYDENFVIKHAGNTLPQSFHPHKFLWMTIGGEEANYVEPLAQLTGVLNSRNPQNLTWEFLVLEKDDHGSSPLKSLYFGLETMFADWQPPQDLAEKEGSLEILKKHFAKLSKKYGYEIKMPEAVVNVLGYQVMGRERFAEAIEIFKTNVKLYPGSANVYDSLGEAYEANNQLELAKENYEIALQKGRQTNDPNLPFYEQHVENIQKKLGGTR